MLNIKERKFCVVKKDRKKPDSSISCHLTYLIEAQLPHLWPSLVAQLVKNLSAMRQVLGPGALGKPRGIRWRGRWEGGSGWGTHVNPWLIHVNV